MDRKRTKAQVDESKEQHDARSHKTVWHPLNLQRVPQGRFVDLVNQILSGKLALFESSLKGASSTTHLDDPSTNRGDPAPSSKK